jgi:alpha-tubulin suppressor-like RCC1 family protein/plastocyanin
MSVSYKSTTSLAEGSWQHLAVTVDQTKGTVSFFLNNTLVGTQNASISILQNSQNILIGRNSDSDFFNGMMDDVRVYSRVLSADELGGLFNYKNEGSLISKYDFEKFDLTEMKVYDEGPYGYTGTLMNVGANEAALTNEVGEFAINNTAFESLVDEYVEIDGSDPTNKLQGVHLNNCTFAAWVKLGASTGSFEPIMVKPGVLSFGVKNGRVVLKLGDGSTLHELPVMSTSDTQNLDQEVSDEQIRVSQNGYSIVDVVPSPTPPSAYFKKMGYRAFEWNFEGNMYDNAAVFKMHSVDARSKTHNKFYVNDRTRMAASFGQLSTSARSYLATNWCRETNNEYWYLRAGYDGIEMPPWAVGKSPLTLTLRFKFLDPSNLNTSAVSIMYGQGAADEGFVNQTWNHAQQENYHVAAELYGNAATTFQMRCSVQEGKAANGRVVSSVFSGTISDIYVSNWNTMILVHDPTNTKSLLYLNNTLVCSVNAVTTFPSADVCKLRVGTYPIDTAKYVNRGIYIKDLDLMDTALSEPMVKHYFQNRREELSSEMSSKGLKAHYTFDETDLGANSSEDRNHLVKDTPIVAGMGLSEGSRAVRFDPTDTGSLEIPGEVFSSDKSFFFGTWIKPESVSGYRPIVSRIEGDNNMHFGVRDGMLEFSASRSAPVTLSKVSAKHVYDHQAASRVCNVLGTVSNSGGGTVYLGLFEKFYSNLMKAEAKGFMVDTMAGSSALKEFPIPSDAFGVSIACSMNEFFADFGATAPQDLSFATQQLNLVVLVVDPSDNLTVKSFPLDYVALNNQEGAHASGKAELHLSDGYTYSLTTMREENTSDEYTDWYLVLNYLRKENETVRAVPRAPIGMSSSSNEGYEGFPMQRQEYDTVDINGEFSSETYDSLDMNAREFGPWGHADNELFGMLVDKLGDHGVEMLFKGKTASHERVMNFSTGWSWLVDYFRNGFEVAPGGFNDSAVRKRPDHTTNLPDEATTFPDNKMDFAMTKYPFYHSSYRNYLGADNDSYWSLDESAKNTTMFQQIWVRGRRDMAKRAMKPMMISNNDARNKSLSMGADCVTGEPYTMVLTNGDTVEMSDCYKDTNKKVSNLFSHSMNDNNHSGYGSGNNWRAIYTFAKGDMEAVSMKFYQAESYQTKSIQIYYTTDDTVSITSPVEDWTPVNNPSLTEFHINTTRTVLRVDFAPVKAPRFMIVTTSWNSGHTYYGLMEWMIYGYDGEGNGVVSDLSDKNAQHNNADSKFVVTSSYEFKSGERSMVRITDADDPYYQLFLKQMNENRGIEDSAFGGSDSVIKAQLNNDDVIYYNCVYSYAANTGWTAYDATNMFKDETILNVIHQNAYNSYQTQGWRFAHSSVTASSRTGSLIYEFANGRPQKIRGIQVHGHTNNSMGFSAKVRVFYSMSDTELEFEEFKEAESAISLLISETNTFVDFGEKFPATNKIMLLFESVWEENFDVAIRDLRIIGSPMRSTDIITTTQLTLRSNNDVVTGHFDYSNVTGKAKLYVNAYAYDYTGGFLSTAPTMTLLPTINKAVSFELTNILSIDNTFVPAKAVNYIKVFALIEDSVLGTRKMMNVATLVPQNPGDVQISIDSLFYDSFLDSVQADIYAYSSYAGITGIYGLLTGSYITEEEESNAKSFILQNASTSNGCVVYKSTSIEQYGIASETLSFSHVLSEVGGALSPVSSGESYYLSVLLEDSSGGLAFSKRNLPTKSIYYDLNRIFAGGHDSSHYTTGFGNNTDRRTVGEGNSLKTWLSANSNLLIREVIGGGHHGYLWCYSGDRDVVYGWGYNAHGELAYITSGTTHNTSVQVNPVECNGITRLLREKQASIVQFKSGNNFGMLLLSDGKMYSWGNISSYATGFSENKTHTTITECDIFTNHCVQNNVTPVDFACTQSNTIILFSDGTVWGIGNNSNGLLGLGHGNATGPVLVACTNVNAMLEDGYEIDLMCSRGNAMTYRLKKRGTDELSWWGMGENRNNRALGTTVAAPVLDMTRLDLMEDLIATFPDPKNYVVGVGPSHWTNCCIIDLTSNAFWFVGYGHYMHWSDYSNWTDRTSQVNMGTNKFVFCAMFSYGIFLASTNDRNVEYKVLDTRSIITSHRLNVTNASTDWSSSSGVTFSGTISASDVHQTSTYTLYATSDLNKTRQQALSVISAGSSPALQIETISINERLSLKNHIVRNMEVSGKVVPSNAYPKYKLFVYVESDGQQSMEVLINQDEPVPSLFPNVVEGSFDPFDKVLKVKASVTDSLNTPSNMYVAAFAEPPSNSMTNTDIKNIILSTKHLSQVKSLSLSGLDTGDVFLSNTLSFGEVFSSVYPQLDEATYESMKANGGTEVVSENSSANIGLAGSTSDATWYVWENKYQSGQTVKKWTLHNGDSLYTNSHGEKWFDGNQTDDANYQPQMYNTNETWIVQGTSRGSVKSWRYFYDVAEPRTINTFKLFNHSTNGAHFIKSIGVWNTTKQIYEPVQLNSSSFPMNCFEGTSTSAYKNMHLSFEAVTLEPGKPLMIHMGKMATNLYVNEMQLVYETPPPVIPTFFKYLKLRVRTNNGGNKYFTFSDLAVLNMQIQSVTTSASTAHGHAISRIVDDNPDTYHQTERTSAFDVFLTFTHGLPTMFQMKFVNIWNDQAWKDVDVFVSTDNTNWMLSKEIRGLGYAVKEDLLGRTTVVECALPPNVVPAQDLEYSIYAVAENSVGNTSISKFTPPPTKKAYLFDRVKSMGYNNHYEASRGTDKTDKSFDVATEVTKFLEANPSIQMIDIIGGGHFTIFEVRNKDQQEFYGIGYNTQRGIGGFDDTNHQSTVVECTGIHSLMNSEKSRVKKLACGWFHCMVLLENGKMYSFGYNGYGQLGTNNTSDGGKNGLESVMINDYCEENDTEVLDFACTAYNTFVYLKNNTIRVAGRWNGHGQLGRNNTSETNNTTFYHVTHMDNYLGNAKIDFMKCDYGSVMYRVVKNDTGDAKWYGAGQNTDKSIGYNGGQTQVIVECDLLNEFIAANQLEGNYEVVKGIMRSTILIDNRDGRLYGIGDFGQYIPDMNDQTSFTELTNTNGATFLNYDELINDSKYPMRVVKYTTLAHNIYVGGTALTGIQPFEYLETPTGNLNIMRIKNFLLTTPDNKGVASLRLSVKGSILEDTRYYVVLTTDDRNTYDFNDEANADEQATYKGVLPRNESLRFEVAVTEILDLSDTMTALSVVSKIRAYVFVTDGIHKDYQVYDFGPYVSHPTSAVTSVSFSPITDTYQVDMSVSASKEAVNSYNMLILHPDAEFPDMGEKLSYDTPLIADSHGTYQVDASIVDFTVSGWVRPGERSLIKQTGAFDISIDADGKMQAEIQSVYKTSHLERQVETPASSTLWRLKIYSIHGGHSDYATFTQLVLTDENDTYPTTRHDQGANTLFDRVGTTNSNVYKYNQGHKVTYEYASDFTPTKMIWAYKATNPTRAPTRFLIQYCTTTNRTTEADWEDYVYVDLDVNPATNTTPTFHYVDINVTAPNTPRTLSFASPNLFPSGDLELISPVNPNADDPSIDGFIYMQSTYFADQPQNKRGPVKYIFNQTYRADGNNANYGDWVGSVNTGGLWAVFDLGSAKSMTHLRIWHSRAVKEMPHDFKIAMFDDNTIDSLPLTNGGAVSQLDAITAEFQYSIHTPEEHTFMLNGEKLVMDSGVFGSETLDPMVVYSDQMNNENVNEENGYHEFNLSNFNLNGRYMVIGFYHNPVTSGEYTKLQELRLYTQLPPQDPSTIPYEHVGMTVEGSTGKVQFFKKGGLSNTFENNHIRIPAVDAPYTLDPSADTRYLALRKGVLSKKNMINEHFRGRQDLISLITSNSTENILNIPVGKHLKTTTSFTSALESLESLTSLTVVPEIAYKVLGVLTDVNGSVVFGDQLDAGTQYTTVTYGWASGHNNGYMMMFADGLQGNPEFYPTKILHDFLNANPTYKCLNIEMGGYALMCMFEVDGVIKLYATGYNAQGQIGNGNTTNQSTMVEANLFNDYALENNTTVKMVRVGWNTTCVLYENGIVMCVGTNGGCYANGNDTASSTALVEASLVTAYCQTNDVEIVDFSIASGECCYLFSNGKVLGNGYAMGTADNTHNLLKETALNDLMGTDYECTLIRSMHKSFNFRLTHKTTGEEKWYGTGYQHHNGGGAAANQAYYTTMTPLTKLEALLASFEDPKDYTYVMGCFQGASFVRDNRTDTFWRIGYMAHIPAFGNTTEFVEVTTYITKDWCETNTHSRLTNFTPVYWRMNGYGIFAFGNPLGVEPDVIGGGGTINLTTMSIEDAQGSFEPFPAPVAHVRHSDVGTANDHQTQTTSTETGMTYVQTLSNGDKAHSSATFVNERNVAQIFTGVYDNWSTGAWHGPNGTTTMSAVYEFTDGEVFVDTMNFVNVPGNNHWAGDIQISYWDGSAYVDVTNRSAAGFSNAVHSEEISITFDQVSSFKFKIVVDRHANNTTTYVGLSEWSIHGLNMAPDASDADFLTMENTDDTYSSSSPAPVTQNEISFSSAEKRYLMNFDTTTVGDYVEMELDVTGTYGSGNNTVRFADSLYLRQPGANPTSIQTDIYKFDTAHSDYSVSGNNLVRTDGASFKVKKMRLTSVAPADVPANPSGEGGAGTTYQNTYVSGANAIRLDFYDSLNADTPVMYTYTEWIHGQDGIFTEGFPIVYPLRAEYSEIDFTLRLLDVGSPSTESSTVSPVLYTNLTMKGSTTESTYYAVATLDSTLDMVRMKNLISTSNPALVSGTLEKNADGVIKSLSLKKVVDAHTNVYDLKTVPYVHLMVYLKDANGVEDFQTTAQILRPNVDLSVPYLQVSSALYDSGSVIVEGTLFDNTAQLTGYYLSAFQNSTPGDYLVSTTPTAMPTGESMLVVSTSPNVPFVFSVTLDTVYADDTYASSSDIFGNEGQLALRLITTDGTTAVHKDFDYALGDFIVSTVAVYASTNDSITATVTKKNNIDPEKIYQYILFASVDDLSYMDIVEVAIADKYKTIRNISDTEPVSVSKVIDVDNNSVYDIAQISTASLYTFATEVPPSAGLDVGAPPTAKKYWKVWWNIATASHRYNRNGEIGIYNSRYLEVEPGQQIINHPEPHALASALTGPISNTHNIPKLYDGTYMGQQYEFGSSRDVHSIVYNFSEPQSIVQILANGPHDETSTYLGGIKVMKIYSSDDNSTWTQIGSDIPFEDLLKEHAVATGTSSHLNIWNAYVQSLQFVDGDWSYRGSFLCPDFNKDPNDYIFTPSIEIPPLSTNPVPYPIGSLKIPYSITKTHVSRSMPSVKIGETEIDSSNRLILKTQQVSAVEPNNTFYTFGLKLASDASTTHFKNVTASEGKYIVDGAEQPTLTMYLGDHLNMVLDISSHPLWIKTVDSTGPSNAVIDVINNGAENGVLFWTPTAVGTYYYNCEYHGHMKGTIKVLNKLSMTHLNTDHVSTLANHIFASDVTTSDTYTPVTASFNIRADSGYYYLNDVYQPTVTLTIGDTVTFTLDGSMSGHPLWIKTERSTGDSGAVTDVNDNGANTGQISWAPTSAATYYYNCQHHSSMGGSIVVAAPVVQSEFVSNGLSNVSTQTVSGTDIALFDTPLILTDIFTSIQGDVKSLDESDQNILMVSLLKSGDNAGYVSRYAILQMDVDVNGAQHGTNNGHSILTDVTENGFTHRNSHGTWDYYVKLDEIGLNGIGFNTGLVFEYKTDRATNHRYQPFTLFQDQTSILSIYCSFHSNSFGFNANMSTSTQSALRSQLVLGDDYKISGTTTLTIEPKNGSLSNVTHMFHRFIFVDHETDPDLFDIVFEFLDQDRNLIFRSRMDYFHTNSASAFGGVATPSNFSKSMTSFDVRVYSYANQTAIQYSDFSLTNKNAIRDSFTPLNGSSYPANQTFSS